MTNNNRSPGRILVTLMASAVAIVGMSASAEDAPPQMAFVEAYQCTFNPDMGPADVMKARDYYVRQSEKAGIEPPDAFFWLEAIGDGPYDSVWFNVHENLAQFGAWRTANGNSDDMSDVLPRFYEVSTCTTALGTIEPLAGEGASDDASFVSSIGCNVKDGITEADIQDLMNHGAAVVGAMENQPASSWLIDPFTGTGNADYYLISVFKNAEDWGNFISEFATSEAGQMYLRHRDTKAECALSLWDSQTVVGSFEE